MNCKTICIIVPCFNEEDTLPLLIDELNLLAESIPHSIKILFVDDGSSDRTKNILCDACSCEKNYGLISFSRNFGHQAAVSAGLAFAVGDAVAVIDADMQDPPSLLKSMIEKWMEGYDVVYGVRLKRKESIFLKCSYKLFYRLLKKLSNIDLPVDAGDFSLMDRKVVDSINALPEHNRYIRGLRGWLGYKQVGIPYERPARLAGTTKYNFERLLNLALDGIISFSTLPLRLAAWCGIFMSIAGLFLIMGAVWARLVSGVVPPGWTSLVILFLLFGGIQLTVLGIIGEYVGRIFDEVKNRPNFVVNQTAGWVNGRNLLK